MSGYSRESFKKNNEKIKTFFRFLNRAFWTDQGLIFPILLFFLIKNVAKYGCVTLRKRNFMANMNHLRV